jgi:hypothetical protein
MKDDVECPYCGAEVEIDHDDGYGYAEDETHHQQCHECLKTFVYTTAVIFHHSAEQADCLNDGEHQYEKTRTHPINFARLRCKTCGDEKLLTPESLPPDWIAE